MAKLTNNTNKFQIVTLDDGSSVFMKSGQVSTTKAGVKFAPEGVIVDTSSSVKKPKQTPKTSDSSENENLEDKS